MKGVLTFVDFAGVDFDGNLTRTHEPVPTHRCDDDSLYRRARVAIRGHSGLLDVSVLA